MHVPLLDLKAQYATVKTEIDEAIKSVFQSQHFILGPKVKECEEAIAKYSSCRFGVGVSSGTDALLICLMAEGIGAGDEVITTPFTFFATAGAIARSGAKPVFVDIDPGTYNIAAEQIKQHITAKTKAIIPVHLYGQMADMDLVMEIADRHRVVIIEDAAQAIGAEYKGRRAGSIGHYGCFSFFPSKNLGAAGDAGMVVTNDEARAEKLACLRAHGSKPKYYHKLVGGNFRLDALQAAIILAKFTKLDKWTAARQSNASRYEALFRASGLEVLNSVDCGFLRAGNRRSNDATGWVMIPRGASGRHIWNQYIIRTPKRDELKAHLLQSGIETEIYYPVPMHLQECFSGLGYKRGDFPESEKAAEETLGLPIYPELSDEKAAYVVEMIGKFNRK